MDIENLKCIAPWNMLRIEQNGECYICTSAFHKYSLGNIFKNSFDEIWNGEVIEKMREAIINNEDFFNCKRELCCSGYNINTVESLNFNLPIDLETGKYTPPPQPSLIYFAFDYSCKQKCIFCRDKIKMFSKEEIEKWQNILEEKIFPIIKDVKIIEMNHAGEFLDGIFAKNLIKKLIELNPNIKFNIISNGINLNEENLRELNLIDRINTIHISLHSATKDTYKKIFRQDNFDKVIKNLEFLKNLKNSKKFKNFEIMFVICSLNYRDMIKFVKLSEYFNAKPAFSLMNFSNNSEYAKDKEEYEIFSPSHYLYNDFVKIIKNKIFIEYKDVMPGYLMKLEYISHKQQIKNYWKMLNKKFNSLLKNK